MQIDGFTGFAAFIVLAIILFLSYQAGKNQLLG